MFKIGEFSKISQVSIKTLRYYDHLGLLKPAHIDRFNGYRYYTLTQLPKLYRILALKDLDFSLDQIQSMLNQELGAEALVGMLEDKAAELRQRITSEHARLYRVESRLNQLARSSRDQSPPVVLKSAPDVLIASVRETLPSIQSLQDWQQAQLIRIYKGLDQQGLPHSGPDLLIYHQNEYRDMDLDVEVGRILHEVKEEIVEGLLGGLIQLRMLPGAPQLATTIHTGKPGSPSDAYASLAKWTQANGFRPVGPCRELTYQQDKPELIHIIEVQQPVMNAINFYPQLEAQKMEPKFFTKPNFTLMGLRYFGKNEKGEISELWEKFNQRIEQLGGLPYETGEAAIGLCSTLEDPHPEGAFEYVAGFPVSKVEQVPEGFVLRQIPEHTYAVFAHRGDLASLGKTYEYIYEVWLPQSGYNMASKIDFEYYDQDFKDFAPDSVFYIYVPIEKA